MLVVMSSDGQTAGSKAQSRTTEAASHVQYYQWSIISITIKPGPVCVHVKDLEVPFFFDYRSQIIYGTGSNTYNEIYKNIVTLAIKLSLYFVVTVIIFYLLNCGDVYLDFMIVLLLRFLC